MREQRTKEICYCRKYRKNRNGYVHCNIRYSTKSSGDNNNQKVNEKVDYLFVGQGTKEAEGFFNLRCQALVDALEKHGIAHDYYIGGAGGHDWGTWRHLLYHRFLPNLWKTK